MSYDIFQNDILRWASEYDGAPFHAALMDAPYHLTELNKRFSKPDSAPAQYGSDGAFQRASKGFMGKSWDGGDIAFRPETWATIASHVHPGGFIVSFAGSRGWHRMACAMEDAGLLIHPTIFCWAYGSGFPKATRLDTQIDRRAGAARTVVGQRRHQPKFAAAELGYREKDNGYNSRDRESFDLTEPATEMARDWAGYRYGGQVLKPAVEPIIVAQRPYAGRPIDSITRTGAGALWIDGARIESGEEYQQTARVNEHLMFGAVTFPGNGTKPGFTPASGRWPSNLILSHAPECTTEDGCVPGCPVRRLGEQSGESESKASNRGLQASGQHGGTAGKLLNLIEGTDSVRGHDDSGTAARFFFNADWMYERLEQADPVGYYAKASSAEREAGLDDIQMRIMRDIYDDENEFQEATINDGRQTPIDNPYQRGKTTRKNIHPTLKPISLNRWLATLLLPPERYTPRRLLVPFAGAGSEIIGAMLAGWEDVVGIELEAEHVRIAKARIAYWSQMRHRAAERAIKPRIKKADSDQLELF